MGLPSTEYSGYGARLINTDVQGNSETLINSDVKKKIENIIHKIITEIFSDTETFNNKDVSHFPFMEEIVELNIDFPDNKKP